MTKTKGQSQKFLGGQGGLLNIYRVVELIQPTAYSTCLIGKLVCSCGNFLTMQSHCSLDPFCLSGPVHSTSLTVGVPLYFEHDAEDGTGAQGHLINLIDSPGHADLSSEADLVGVGCWEPGLRIWNFGFFGHS